MLTFNIKDCEILDNVIKLYPNQKNVKIISDVLVRVYLNPNNSKSKKELYNEIIKNYEKEGKTLVESTLRRMVREYKSYGITKIVDFDDIVLSYLQKHPYAYIEGEITYWNKRSLAKYFNDDKLKFSKLNLTYKLSETKAYNLLCKFYEYKECDNEIYGTNKYGTAIVKYSLDEVQHKRLKAYKDYTITTMFYDEIYTDKIIIKCCNIAQLKKLSVSKQKKVNDEYIAYAILDTVFKRTSNKTVDYKIGIVIEDEHIHTIVENILKSIVLLTRFIVIKDRSEYTQEIKSLQQYNPQSVEDKSVIEAQPII